MIAHILYVVIFLISLLNAYIEAGWTSVRIHVEFTAHCYSDDRVVDFNVSLWEKDGGKRGVLFLIDTDDLLSSVQCKTGEKCTISGVHEEEYPEFYVEINAINCFKKETPVQRICIDFPVKAEGRVEVTQITDAFTLLHNTTTQGGRRIHDCTAYD